MIIGVQFMSYAGGSWAFSVYMKLKFDSIYVVMELGSHYANRTLFLVLGITPKSRTNFAHSGRSLIPRYLATDRSKSNRKATNRNCSNQKANPALKIKTGNN